MAPERGSSMAEAEWRMPREVTPPDMCSGCPGTSGMVLKPDDDGRKYPPWQHRALLDITLIFLRRMVSERLLRPVSKMKETWNDKGEAYLATIVAAMMIWAQRHVRHRHGPKHATPRGAGLHGHMVILWIWQLHELGLGVSGTLHGSHITDELHRRPGERSSL